MEPRSQFLLRQVMSALWSACGREWLQLDVSCAVKGCA